jgi:hypothetical protein
MTIKDKPINFSIKVNDILFKEFSLNKANDLNENLIKLKIKREMIFDNTIYIKFVINNPISPLELLQSPDARKLGILVESIEIINN